MRLPVLAGLGLLAFAASCAPTTSGDAGTPQASTQPRTCFTVQQVNNFRQGRTGQVFLRVGSNDVYELDGAACPDMDNAIRMSLIPDSAGLAGSRICADDWARIVVPGTAQPRTICRVRVSRKLTPAEVEALPAAHQP
jgi:hypothetical protein